MGQTHITKPSQVSLNSTCNWLGHGGREKTGYPMKLMKKTHVPHWNCCETGYHPFLGTAIWWWVVFCFSRETIRDANFLVNWPCSTVTFPANPKQQGKIWSQIDIEPIYQTVKWNMMGIWYGIWFTDTELFSFRETWCFSPVTGLELLSGTLLLFQLLKVKLEHRRRRPVIAIVKRNSWVKDGRLKIHMVKTC